MEGEVTVAKPSKIMSKNMPRVLLVFLALVVAATVPTAALEITGEHRLMVVHTGALEFRAAEALVVRHGGHWLELVVTQKWSRSWPARLEGEVSLWRGMGDVDVGVGYLWRLTEGKGEPWVMVAMPW